LRSVVMSWPILTWFSRSSMNLSSPSTTDQCSIWQEWGRLQRLPVQQRISCCTYWCSG
jgi:hypothetical protein